MNTQLSITQSPFTPGPYTIQRDRDGCDDYLRIVDQRSNAMVASIWFWNDVPEEANRAWANARLLSKAPELVRVLKELLQHVVQETDGTMTAEFYATEYQASLLIAEIEGEPVR